MVLYYGRIEMQTPMASRLTAGTTGSAPPRAACGVSTSEQCIFASSLHLLPSPLRAAGTMGEPGKVTDGAGALYVINGDLTTRKAVPDVTISNGLAWGEAEVEARANRWHCCGQH